MQGKGCLAEFHLARLIHCDMFNDHGFEDPSPMAIIYENVSLKGYLSITTIGQIVFYRYAIMEIYMKLYFVTVCQHH